MTKKAVQTKRCPNVAQRWPNCCPTVAQKYAKQNSQLAQTCPKSWPKGAQVQAKLWPKCGPNRAYEWPKVVPNCVVLCSKNHFGVRNHRKRAYTEDPCLAVAWSYQRLPVLGRSPRGWSGSEGLTTERRTRSDGRPAGKTDLYYLSPTSSVCCSRAEVERYIAKVA